jgi:hypothetical protein
MARQTLRIFHTTHHHCPIVLALDGRVFLSATRMG